MAEHSRRQRFPASRLVRLRQVFGLQSSHIDVAGALALAGLTRETQPQRLQRLRVVPVWRAAAARLAGDRQSQSISPAASGVSFIEGGPIGWAHRADRGSAANPGAVADLCRSLEAFLV